MPKTRIVFFKEDDGTCPMMECLGELPTKARDKCVDRLERLREMGFELRRPEADLLRDKIYELRASYQGIHYRILYFFHGNTAAVVSHGIVKERIVPGIEINRAIVRMKQFVANPMKHGFGESSI